MHVHDRLQRKILLTSNQSPICVNHRTSSPPTTTGSTSQRSKILPQSGAHCSGDTELSIPLSPEDETAPRVPSIFKRRESSFQLLVRVQHTEFFPLGSNFEWCCLLLTYIPASFFPRVFGGGGLSESQVHRSRVCSYWVASLRWRWGGGFCSRHAFSLCFCSESLSRVFTAPARAR